MAKSSFRAGRNEQALIENVEKLTGQRGNGLDRAITLRELHALGLIHLQRTGSGKLRVALPLRPEQPSTGNDTGTPVERPHAPEHFAGLGGFGSILLEWSRPTYSGHAYTEIWRADVNHIDNAVLIATVTSTVHGDIVEPGASFFYWARHVNVADIPGPYHNSKGIKVTTNSNVRDVIDDIADQMRNSPLISELNADIQNVSLTLSNADADIKQQLTTLDHELKTADSALSSQIQSVKRSALSADSAISERLDGVVSEFQTKNTELRAQLTQLGSTVATADEALSTQIQQTISSIDGVSASVQDVSQTLARIEAEGSTAYRAMWSQKAQAGDIKAGIGLLADSSGKSQVAVSASQFFVFDPNSNKPLQPLFAIDNGNTIIPKAFIEKATIQILNAQTIVADEIRAGISLTSPMVNGGKIRGGDAGFGVGGPYAGYHTHISSDGTVRTNRFELRSSANGSRLQISSDRIDVYDGSQLRVRIGRLQ